MKRLWIPNMLAVMVIVGMLLGLAQYSQKAWQEQEGIVLSDVLNYCTDAAVEEMLLSDDLSADYADFGKITVDPQLALDTFVDMFCVNYGLSLSEDNRAHVRSNYIPVFVVAAYDGYYIATPQIVKSDTIVPDNPGKDIDVDLVFSPKMPYTYKSGNNYYALNLNGKDAMLLNTTTKTLSKSSLPAELRSGNSYSKVIAAINAELTNSINNAIAKVNESDINWKNSFFLPPALTSYSRVNPITGPSVIALVQNVDLKSFTPVSAFSIAGSRIQPRYQVACYTREVKGHPVKYYCYVNKIKDAVSVIEYVNTVEDAAKLGYAADVEYLTRE